MDCEFVVRQIIMGDRGEILIRLLACGNCPTCGGGCEEDPCGSCEYCLDGCTEETRVIRFRESTQN